MIILKTLCLVLRVHVLNGFYMSESPFSIWLFSLGENMSLLVAEARKFWFLQNESTMHTYLHMDLNLKENLLFEVLNFVDEDVWNIFFFNDSLRKSISWYFHLWLLFNCRQTIPSDPLEYIGRPKKWPNIWLCIMVKWKHLWQCIS